MKTAGLNVWILTEDTSAQAHPALAAVLKKALQLVVPGAQTQHVRFDPASDDVKPFVRANAWEGSSSERTGTRGREQRDIRTLIAAIATRLRLAGPVHIVCFHFDGDTAWGDRSSAARPARFEARIVRKVRQVLADPTLAMARLDKRPQPTPLTDQALDAACSRLVPIVPYYSVEAWLYQNFREATAACAELREPEGLRQQLDGWAEDRRRLDEIVRLKGECRLRDTYNQRLATRAWPAREVYDVGKSFHATVERLQAAVGLAEALRATLAA